MNHNSIIFLRPARRLSRRRKDYFGELYPKRAAWQEDCRHPQWLVTLFIGGLEETC